MTTLTIVVTAVVPDPLVRDALHPWLVSAEVVEIHGDDPSTGSGGPSTGSGNGGVELLVHSPTREFRDTELVGKTFTIALPDGATFPYVGRFTLVRQQAG